MADDTEVKEAQSLAELWVAYLELREQGKYVSASACAYLAQFEKGMA